MSDRVYTVSKAAHASHARDARVHDHFDDMLSELNRVVKKCASAVFDKPKQMPRQQWTSTQT